MTSRSERRLRARVLYYWALSRGTEKASISREGLGKLLEVAPSSPVIQWAVDDLPTGVRRQWHSGTLTLTLPSQEPIVTDDVRQVFEYWRTRTPHSRSKLTAARKRKIRARLREGYTVDDLKRVVDGALASPWYCGDNPSGTTYFGIETIFRSADVVERLATAKPEKNRVASLLDAIDEEARERRQ